MTKINVFSAKGRKQNKLSLPKTLQGKKNLKLVAQALRVYENTVHTGRSKTKTRGEISLTTRKAYRQKGTGMARHGAKSAPIFVGGSKAHGPKGVKRVLSLGKKMKRKALASIINTKAKEDLVAAVSKLSSVSKTKDAANLLKKIASSFKESPKSERFTVVISEKNKESKRAFRNIKNVKVVAARLLNAHEVHRAGILVIDKDALGEIVQKQTNKFQKTAQKKSAGNSKTKKKGKK